jgi:hypothetical protein
MALPLLQLELATYRLLFQLHLPLNTLSLPVVVELRTALAVGVEPEVTVALFLVNHRVVELLPRHL